MTAHERLHRARTRLALAMAARAALLALVAAAGTLLLVLLADIAIGLSAATRENLAVLPWLAGGLTLAWLGWQAYTVARRANDEQLAL